jgi:hypothetical protein
MDFKAEDSKAEDSIAEDSIAEYIRKPGRMEVGREAAKEMV